MLLSCTPNDKAEPKESIYTPTKDVDTLAYEMLIRDNFYAMSQHEVTELCHKWNQADETEQTTLLWEFVMTQEDVTHYPDIARAITDNSCEKLDWKKN